jgi:hypothetical protein
MCFSKKRAKKVTEKVRKTAFRIMASKDKE